MPDELRLLCWPFHNGLRDVGMGSGALRLASDEPLRDIEAQGWRLSRDEIDRVEESAAEIARVVELTHGLARRVRHAVADGAFPLVLAGNCNSCLGTAAGLSAEELGVIWFDAHADFDDPDENTSGFFDVMGLAMLTGRGWRALRETLPGHRAVSERNVVLAAVRDLAPYQRKRLERSDVLAIPGAIDPERFAEAVGELPARVSQIYLPVDLDSLDAACAHANEYAATGGPGLGRLAECVRLVCERTSVAAAALTAYDPAFDPDERTLAAARCIAHEIAGGVRRHRRPS